MDDARPHVLDQLRQRHQIGQHSIHRFPFITMDYGFRSAPRRCGPLARMAQQRATRGISLGVTTRGMSSSYALLDPASDSGFHFWIVLSLMLADLLAVVLALGLL